MSIKAIDVVFSVTLRVSKEDFKSIPGLNESKDKLADARIASEGWLREQLRTGECFQLRGVDFEQSEEVK